MSEVITLAHGSGGKLTHQLISQLFLNYFSNDLLLQGDDSSCFTLPKGKVAMTTDSFVVSPLFFKGGDIGKLSICGTVNDLAASGASPLYLSCGFILEEGFAIAKLERILESMAKTLAECNVKMIAGDTKVVGRGAADQIFINTTGIGVIKEGVHISGSNAKEGDVVIVSGGIGEHGVSILVEREQFNIHGQIQSDCAPLNGLVASILKVAPDVHVLRDPTRGGLATTLNEIAMQSKVGIQIDEEKIPVRDEVRGVCELLGMDPLYMANEGKMIIIAPKASAQAILDAARQNQYGEQAAVIGEVVGAHPGKVMVKTVTGGSRRVDMLVGEQLPRIC